jgi:hypothetical protein
MTVSKTDSDYSNLGGTLVLLGGILAIVFSVLRLAFTVFLGRIILDWIERPIMLGRWGWGRGIIPNIARWTLGFMTIGAIASIILGIIAIYAYTRVKGGKVRNGGLIAIVVGIIMLVSIHWIVGVITLVGGILCHVSKPATSNSKQSS